MRNRYGYGLFGLALALLALAFGAAAQTDEDADGWKGRDGIKYFQELEGEAITTESGLQYKVLIAGKGKRPKSRSTVKVHYRGLFVDGSMFDTSYGMDEPVEISLRGVIKGWREGLQLMREGAVYVFMIPAELAYGEKGAADIPSNAILIYEIELFEIV